jgi:hypothetical protein
MINSKTNKRKEAPSSVTVGTGVSCAAVVAAHGLRQGSALFSSSSSMSYARDKVKTGQRWKQLDQKWRILLERFLLRTLGYNLHGRKGISVEQTVD